MARIAFCPNEAAAGPWTSAGTAPIALWSKDNQPLPLGIKDLHLRSLDASHCFLLPALCSLPSTVYRPILSATRLLLTAFCLLLSASAPGLAGQGSAQNAATPPRVNPKAQELLDRAIQALGGPAFLRFKTLTTSGRVFAISEESTEGLAPFKSAVEYPDKRRFSYGKKKPVILINNGDRAWELDRFGVTHQLPQQIQRWKLSTRYGLENLLRVRIHDSGVLIQDGGVDFVDNVPTRVVDILDAEGFELKLSLNRQNFLPVRITYRVQNPQTREWEEYADVYGDYQKVQDIQTPKHITRFLNGDRVSETFRNSARYDESYPPNYFEPTG